MQGRRYEVGTSFYQWQSTWLWVAEMGAGRSLKGLDWWECRRQAGITEHHENNCSAILSLPDCDHRGKKEGQGLKDSSKAKWQNSMTSWIAGLNEREEYKIVWKNDDTSDRINIALWADKQMIKVTEHSLLPYASASETPSWTEVFFLESSCWGVHGQMTNSYKKKLSQVLADVTSSVKTN